MRPHGRYREELDILAVRAGLNHIVSPTRKATNEAQRRGLEVIRTRECCVLATQPAD
jgi:uncharacterized radical SAM superfamily protein